MALRVERHPLHLVKALHFISYTYINGCVHVCFILAERRMQAKLLPMIDYSSHPLHIHIQPEIA